MRLATLALALFLLALPAHAALVLETPPEALAETAVLVVEGVVTRTASGFDPDNGSLATYTTLAVDTVHRGPSDLGEVVIREPGGHFRDTGHVVDAVPLFEPGERVLLFLSPARDGALRTVAFAAGKFTITAGEKGALRASRDVSGLGMFTPAAARATEEFTLGELLAVTASVPEREAAEPGAPRGGKPRRAERSRRAPAAPWSAVPPEMPRLLWDGVRERPGSRPPPPDDLPTEPLSGDETPAAPEGVQRTDPFFTPLSSGSPVRWHAADTGTPVTVNIERARDPLGNPQSAVDEMKRAMAAWTNVPEARLVLQAGNDNYDYTGTNPQSPSSSSPPVNIILFGDPYGDIADPSGCSGTLAIGGYWYSGSPRKIVNNVNFYPASKLYVIFNNNFECFLGNRDILAEVATHELGHGIGFGHSTVPDATMRASAYGGGRGPRLGNDDKDGAHCHYPHTLTLSAPNGGESWDAGTVHPITWSCTSEAGVDPGTVDLEYSTDGGSTWKPIRSGEANDGSYSWTVPDDPSANCRLRVLRNNRVSPTPAPYPSACSSDASNGAFAIAASTAGTIPDGTAATTPLTVTRGGSTITLAWGASCSGSATNHAVYEGTLAALKAGTWDHTPRTCNAGADLSQSLTPGAGNRYYLVAPLTASREGFLGKTSAGTDRPASASACFTREGASCP